MKAHALLLVREVMFIPNESCTFLSDLHSIVTILMVLLLYSMYSTTFDIDRMWLVSENMTSPLRTVYRYWTVISWFALLINVFHWLEINCDSFFVDFLFYVILYCVALMRGYLDVFFFNDALNLVVIWITSWFRDELADS